METILRAAIVYWLLFFALRLLARRPGAQMTPFEWILLFLLGGVSIQGIVGDDRSMTNVVLVVLTIVLMHVLISTLKQRSDSFGKVADGTPVLIFCQGKWYEDRMQQLRLQEQDVMSAARLQGIERLDQVKYAIAERNGVVSIIRQEAK